MNNPASRRAVAAIDTNWAIVAAGALMTCVAIGVVFSLAVFLEPMSAATGWSRAGISSAMTFAFLSMGVAGFGWAGFGIAIASRMAGDGFVAVSERRSITAREFSGCSPKRLCNLTVT